MESSSGRMITMKVKLSVSCASCVRQNGKNFISNLMTFLMKFDFVVWRKQSVENVSAEYSKWFHLNLKTLMAFFINSTFEQFSNFIANFSNFINFCISENKKPDLVCSSLMMFRTRKMLNLAFC